MNFIEATNQLFQHIGAEELADALAVSTQSVRQARMNPNSAGYRSPPAGWEKAVIKLAEQHSKELSVLAAKLKKAMAA